MDNDIQILFSFNSDKDRRTDSWIRRKNTAQPRRESNPGSCEILSHALTTELRSHDGIRLSVLLSLIRNDPDQSEFTTMILFQVEPWLADHIYVDKCRMLWLPGQRIEKYGTKIAVWTATQHRAPSGHFLHIRLITKNVPHGSTTNHGKHSTFPTKDHGTYHETRESREQRKREFSCFDHHDVLAIAYFSPQE